MPINNPFEFFIQLHLTERCNLRCKHCYQNGSRPDEMSLSEIQSVLDEIGDMINDWTEAYEVDFACSFNITGGEPFLRQDIFNVLEELKNKGFDTYLLSNGTLINPEIAAAVAKLQIKGVQISVEGPENIHDAIRGSGSFALSVKGIRNLVDTGINVTLNTTLSGMNAPYFMDVIDLASSLGVQKVGFSRLVPSGSGREMLDTMLKKEELENLYNKIFTLTPGGLQIVTGDPVASQMRNSVADSDEEPFPSGGCAAGVSGMTILPDGTITPCRRLPIAIGNVRKDSLREIWASSETLRELRDKSRYKGKCGQCSRWSGCRGCRAIAFAFSGANGCTSHLAEDPQCFLQS